MYTPEELVNFCDKKIKKMGMSKPEFLRSLGLSDTLFIMSAKRSTHIKLETLELIANKLGVTMKELLGLEDKEPLPEDVDDMLRILLDISEKDRKVIQLNLKNYYDLVIKDKNV